MDYRLNQGKEELAPRHDPRQTAIIVAAGSRSLPEVVDGVCLGECRAVATSVSVDLPFIAWSTAWF